jgi:hypothetical protein
VLATDGIAKISKGLPVLIIGQNLSKSIRSLSGIFKSHFEEELLANFPQKQTRRTLAKLGPTMQSWFEPCPLAHSNKPSSE